MAHGVILTGHGTSLRDLTVLVPATVPGVGPAFAAVVVLAFLPAMIVARIAQFYRLRSPADFLVTGGIIGIVCRLILSAGIAAWIRAPNPRVSMSIFSSAHLLALTITAVAGAVAGYIYWSIAGRNAGRWRDAVMQ